MKRILFSIALLFCIGKMNAQIVAEHTYAATYSGFSVYRLDVSGLVYVWDSSTNQTFNIKLYNLNHTLFKNIHFANPYAATYGYNARIFFSENLFDNDAQVEFAVNYVDDVNTLRFVIYNEDGSILFNKNNAKLDWINYNRDIQNGPYSGIIPTPNGTKMILGFNNPPQYKVYSLPGSLPCWECSDGSFTGNRQSSSGYFPEGINSQIFPNPSSSQTEIAYELPDGCMQATLSVFSLEGTMLKIFTITSDFDSVVLSNEDLAAGTYFYKIETPKGESDAKKFVIVQQ